MSDIDRAAIESDEQSYLAPIGAQVLNALDTVQDLQALEACRVEFLGKSGTLTKLLKDVGTLPAAERPIRAALRNKLKETVAQELESRRHRLEGAALRVRLNAERIDISAPPRPEARGAIHPISRTMEEIAAIFGAMGFALKEGPDIEDDLRALAGELWSADRLSAAGIGPDETAFRDALGAIEPELVEAV